MLLDINNYLRLCITYCALCLRVSDRHVVETISTIHDSSSKIIVEKDIANFPLPIILLFSQTKPRFRELFYTIDFYFCMSRRPIDDCTVIVTVASCIYKHTIVYFLSLICIPRMFTKIPPPPMLSTFTIKRLSPRERTSKIHRRIYPAHNATYT